MLIVQNRYHISKLNNLIDEVFGARLNNFFISFYFKCWDRKRYKLKFLSLRAEGVAIRFKDITDCFVVLLLAMTYNFS